ncbi:MAG TPA: SMP-30/gluconolactonase/LRE family protein [Ignavibacteriaceae bacterium]
MRNKIFFILLLNLFVIITAKNYSQIIDTNEKWIKVADGLNFAEGPANHDSIVYFSNCYGGWIAEYSNAVLDTFISYLDDSLLIQKTNGLAYGKDNYLYVCEYGKGKILRVDSLKNIEVYADRYKGERFNRPNDLVLVANGNLFFTDPKSYDVNILDGRIFFIDVITKEVSIAEDSLAFPNGINISPIDGKLYVCESAKQKIVRYTITDQNKLIEKEDFVKIPGGDPDGIEFDIEGNLYAAHFGGKAVYIFSPDGKLLQKIETPGVKPTNLEFGGKDFRTLYLTEVETNALYKIRTIYAGKNSINNN